MLSLKEILNYYPEFIRTHPHSREYILKEYLQYKILDSIFNSDFASKLAFLGGTALRIIYVNQRFSEDLDFDNFGLTAKDFEGLSEIVKKSLEREGYEVEIKNVFKGAYRCYIRLPNLFHENRLSGHKGEKILIQLDTAPHHFKYQPDIKFLHRFGIFTQIFVTPLDIILSQKIYAAFDRKRAKGRDFYDIMFLLTKTKPNYAYLKVKIRGVHNAQTLQDYLSQHYNEVDFDLLSKNVQPFLFDPKDAKKLLLFPEYINQTLLEHD